MRVPAACNCPPPVGFHNSCVPIFPPAESYLSTDLAAAFRTITGITGRLYDWQAECLTTPGVLHVSAGRGWQAAVLTCG